MLITSCTLVGEITRRTWVFLRMKEKHLPTSTKHGKHFHFKSEQCAPRVVLGATVDTRPQSDAEAASGDRPTTAPGDREQDVLDWLQPFTEGLEEGASGSSGSAGETIPKTLAPHLPEKPSNKNLE